MPFRAKEPVFTHMAVFLVAAALSVLAAAKAAQNQERLQLFRLADSKRRAASESRDELLRSLRLAHEASITAEEFAARFDDLDERERTVEPDGEVKLLCYHPASMKHYRVFFREGRFNGYATGDLAPIYSTAGLELESPAFLAGEKVRKAILEGAVPLWAFLLFAVLFFPSVRMWRVPELLFLTAFLCFLCWLLSPGYTVTLRGVSSNDRLFFGTLMLVVSLAVWLGAGLEKAIIPQRPSPSS